MANYSAYLPHELEQISAQNLSLAEITQTNCPVCHNQTIRIYIHDLDHSRTKSAEWIWCHVCRKYAHHRVGLLPMKYQYSDPLTDERFNDNLCLTGDKWYEFLNSLYDRGVLPQTISKRK